MVKSFGFIFQKKENLVFLTVSILGQTPLFGNITF